MGLYRITPDKLEPVARTTFAAEGLMERKDIQRYLRRDISVIGEDRIQGLQAHRWVLQSPSTHE